MRLIIFDSDIDSNSTCPGSDSLEIRVGMKSFVSAKSVLKQDCGKKNPFVLDISSSAIYIKFVTDGAGGARGFMVGVATYVQEEEFAFDVIFFISVRLYKR